MLILYCQKGFVSTVCLYQHKLRPQVQCYWLKNIKALTAISGHSLVWHEKSPGQVREKQRGGEERGGEERRDGREERRGEDDHLAFWSHLT